MEEKAGNGTNTASSPAMATPVGDANHSFTGASGNPVDPRGPMAHEHEQADVLPVPGKPHQDQGERERQSLEELSRDSRRTHRDWYPKYGRVQKCDWCNERATGGTLHVCTKCGIRMCEKCARERRWHTNYSHFIDADALDWKPKSVPKKGSSKRRAPSREPSDPPPRRRRSERLAGGDLKEHRDDISSQDGDNPAGLDFHNNSRYPPPPTASRHGFDALSQPPTPRGHYDHGSGAPPPYRPASAYPGSYRSPPPRMDLAAFSSSQGLAAPPMTNTPAAERSLRSSGHEAGPMAMSNITEQPRPLSGARFDYGEAVEGGYNENARIEHYRDCENRPVEKGDTEYGDETRRHRDDRGRVDGIRAHTVVLSTSTDRVGDQPAQTGTLRGHLPPWADYYEHDLLVDDIYSSIYGHRPNFDSYRTRTQIPDRWAGDWLASTSQHYGGLDPYYAQSTHSAPNNTMGRGYEHHHTNEVHPRQQHMYPHHSHYQCQYSEQHCHQRYPGPLYPPGPDPDPYEMARRHDTERTLQADRATLQEMQTAWARHPVLNQLVAGDNKRVYALGVLWDVFELRRAGADLPLRDNSQTVRWFVCERDAQFRLQHEEELARQRRRHQYQYQYRHQHQPPPAATGGPPAYPHRPASAASSSSSARIAAPAAPGTSNSYHGDYVHDHYGAGTNRE